MRISARALTLVALLVLISTAVGLGFSGRAEASGSGGGFYEQVGFFVDGPTPVWSLHQIVDGDRVASFEADVVDGVFRVGLPESAKNQMINLLVRGRGGESQRLLYQAGADVVVPEEVRHPMRLTVRQAPFAKSLVGHLMIADAQPKGVNVRVLREHQRFVPLEESRYDVQLSARDLAALPHSTVFLLVYEVGAQWPCAIKSLGSAIDLLSQRPASAEVELRWRTLQAPKWPAGAIRLVVSQRKVAKFVVWDSNKHGKQGSRVPDDIVLDVGSSDMLLHVEYADRWETLLAAANDQQIEPGESQEVVEKQTACTTLQCSDDHDLAGGPLTVAPDGLLSMDFGIDIAGSMIALGRGANAVTLTRPRGPVKVDLRGQANFPVLCLPREWDEMPSQLRLGKVGQVVFPGAIVEGGAAGIGFARNEMHIVGADGMPIYQAPINAWPWRTPLLPYGAYRIVATLGDTLIAQTDIDINKSTQRVDLVFHYATVYRGRIASPSHRAGWWRVRAAEGSTCPWAWVPVPPDGTFRLAGSTASRPEPVVVESMDGRLKCQAILDPDEHNEIIVP